jgi:ABC-type transporter Mla maintaining outer membrane lipid asymmetry permease subunit MlaE
LKDKFATVAAVFIPLGFLGGLLQGSILLGIGSAIFWAIIFSIVRPKNPPYA